LSTRSDRGLRALTATYGLVFLASSLQNFGLRLSFGPLDFYFGEPIWQAGAGEAVIGVLLVAAALREGRALYWTAYVLSVLGIAFDCRPRASSERRARSTSSSCRSGPSG